MEWSTGELTLAAVGLAALLIALFRLSRPRRRELDRSADMATLIFPPATKLGRKDSRDAGLRAPADPTHDAIGVAVEEAS